MTPEERATRLARELGYQFTPATLRVIADAIRAALEAEREAAQVKIGKAFFEGVEIEREACAKACDDISVDKWQQYKGRGSHAPNNSGRADPFIGGQSHGADVCAAAIRARGEKK